MQGRYNQHECGLEITAAQAEDDGDWTCQVESYVRDGRRGEGEMAEVTVWCSWSDLVNIIISCFTGNFQSYGGLQNNYNNHNHDNHHHNYNHNYNHDNYHQHHHYKHYHQYHH